MLLYAIEHESIQSKVRGMDILAEWLRRRPAKPMGSPRVGSNPTGVVMRRRLRHWWLSWPSNR